VINIKRWLVITLACAALALLLAIAGAFMLRDKARADAAKYLHLVMPLRIGTPYDVVASQLRDAGLPVTSVGDCHQECNLRFLVGDKWLHKLRLAPAVGFYGRLDFRGATLVYKFTSMGQDIMVWSATVSEGSPPFGSLVPGIHGTQDSSGNIRTLSIQLSSSDFTENRKNAYAFNLACIGSMRGCRADQYLPMAVLKRSFSQTEGPK
jgi:hypothetical protein